MSIMLLNARNGTYQLYRFMPAIEIYTDCRRMSEAQREYNIRRR